MTKKIIYFLYVSMFLLFACEYDSPCVDKKVKAKFEAALRIVDNSENEPVNHAQYAIFFLTEITQLKHSCDDIKYAEYRNKPNKPKDIKKWKQWFKENKCKYNISQVDSIVKETISTIWTEMSGIPF